MDLPGGRGVVAGDLALGLFLLSIPVEDHAVGGRWLRVVGVPGSDRSRVVRDALVRSGRGLAVAAALDAIAHAVLPEVGMISAASSAQREVHAERLGIIFRSLAAQAATIAADLLAALPDDVLPALSLPAEVREALVAPEPRPLADPSPYYVVGRRRPIACDSLVDTGLMAADVLAMGAFRGTRGTPQQTTLDGVDIDPFGEANSHPSIRVMQTTPFMPDGVPASAHMMACMSGFAEAEYPDPPPQAPGQPATMCLTARDAAWRIGVCPGTVLQHVLWGGGSGAVRAWLGLPWDQSHAMFSVDGAVGAGLARHLSDPYRPAVMANTGGDQRLIEMHEGPMRAWATLPTTGRVAYLLRAAGLRHPGYYMSGGKPSRLRMATGAAGFGLGRRLVDCLASPMADAVSEAAGRIATAGRPRAVAYTAEAMVLGADRRFRALSAERVTYTMPA